MIQSRYCEVCGKNQYRKKVWATHRWTKHITKVICYGCAYDGWYFWIDGSLYNRNTGPSPEQIAMLPGKEHQ